MRNPIHGLLPLAALAALGMPDLATAQVGGEETVKKILEDVDRDMKEIDRLLMESARAEGGGGKPTTDQAREKVGRTRDSQNRVVEGIDRLLDELQKMAQQSSSSSSSSQQQQQQQQQDQEQQQQQGNQRQRQETETPDMVDQGQQQQQQEGQPQQQDGQQQDGQQQQPQQGQQANDGQDRPNGGDNVYAGERNEGGTERVERGDDSGAWGRLPPYARFLHSRGGVPEVPARYRRLYEAWQKRVNQRENAQRSPSAPSRRR